MNSDEYLRQAEAAGSIFGGAISDILERDLGAVPFATAQDADAGLAMVRASGLDAIEAKDTSPFSDDEAAAAWRRAAASVVSGRLKTARHIVVIDPAAARPAHG